MATKEAIQEKINLITEEISKIEKPIGSIVDVFGPDAHEVIFSESEELPYKPGEFAPKKQDVPAMFPFDKEEIALVNMMTCGDVQSAKEYEGFESSGTYNSQHQNFMFATDHILGVSMRVAKKYNLDMLRAGRDRGYNYLMDYVRTGDASGLGKSMRESYNIMMDCLTSRSTMDVHTAHYSKLLGMYLDFMEKHQDVCNAAGLTEDDIKSARGLTGLYDIYKRNLESRKALLTNMLNGGKMTAEEKENNKMYILLNVAIEKDMRDKHYEYVKSDEYKAKESSISEIYSRIPNVKDEQEKQDLMSRANNENAMLGLHGYPASDYMKISNTLNSGDMTELPDGMNQKIKDFVKNNNEETWLMSDNEVENLDNLLKEIDGSQKTYLFGMFKPSGSEYYKEVQNSLHELVNQIRSARMKPEDNAKVVNAYSKLGIACEKYLEKRSGVRSTSEGRHRQEVVKSLLGFCKKDYAQISGLSSKDIKNAAEEGKNYSELISDIRMDTVQLPPENEINKVGGALSKRLVIKDNEKGLDGFFTEPSYVYSFSVTAAKTLETIDDKYKKVFKKLLDGLNQMKPEELLDFIDNKLFNNDGVVIPSEIAKYKLKKTNEGWEFKADGEKFVIPDTNEAMVEFSKFKMGLYEHIKFQGEQYVNAKKPNQPRLNIYSKEVEEYQIHKVNGALKDGRELSKRNVAMSRVAILMGMDDVVAKSKTMKVRKDDGTELTGVYMEKAKGMDLDTLIDKVRYENSMGSVLVCKNPDYKFSFTKSDDMYVDGNFKLKLADMNILDIICGNPDRHGGNMTYVFKKTKNGYQLSDVQGIDNDLSFGNTLKIDGELVLYDRNRLDYIRCVRRQTADKINALTKDTLKFILGDLIQEDEIESAWERIQAVKDYLDEHYDLIKEDGEIINGSFKKMFDDVKVNKSGEIESPMIGTMIKFNMDKFGEMLDDQVAVRNEKWEPYVQAEIQKMESELIEKIPGFREFLEKTKDESTYVKSIKGKDNEKFRQDIMETYKRLYDYAYRENVLTYEKRLAADKYLEAMSFTVQDICIKRNEENKICGTTEENIIKNRLKNISRQVLAAKYDIKKELTREKPNMGSITNSIATIVSGDYLNIYMASSVKNIKEKPEFKSKLTKFEKMIIDKKNLLNDICQKAPEVRNEVFKVAGNKDEIKKFVEMTDNDHMRLGIRMFKNPSQNQNQHVKNDNSHKNEMKAKASKGVEM